MQNTRTIAKTTGWSLVLMAVIAGFAFGFAFPKIYKPDQLDFVQDHLTANLSLYKFMLLGILLVMVLDLLVSWTLYLYFKADNKRLALWSCILRVGYTLIFGIATYYLAINLGLSDSNSLAVENYQAFQTIWSIGLVVFGVHLLAIGVLMKLHKLIPKVLWYLTLIAGASYILVHLLKAAAPQLAELSNTLNAILALPMALGELGLAIWLILKGGKT